MRPLRPRRPSSRATAPVAALLSVLLLLSGCYLPVRWDAEIEITRYGAFSMIFDGYIAYVPLFEDARNNAITPSEEREKVDIVLRDLTRDSATKRFTYVRDGLFNLHWEKEGDITATPMITFFRRNQAFLTIKYIRETGLVTMEGPAVRDSQVQRLNDMGLGTEGQLRVKTDARVIEHNAQRVSDDIHRFHIWDVRSLQDPAPKLVLSLR